MQAGYRFAEAVLVRPDGSAVVVPDVELEAARFTIRLKLARGRGIYRLAITGSTKGNRTHNGLRVWLYAGVPDGHPDEPPPEDVKPDPRLPGEVLAVDLFRRVNAHRETIGEKPLAWHEPLAQAARLHAAECVKRKKVDHSFPGVGTVAWRAQDLFGFPRLVYTRPPGKPVRGPAPPSYIATLLDARRGIEPLLHRWQRIASFCLPMTSDRMTHAACGIGRTPQGSVYVVFVLAQLNGPQIERLTEAAHAAAVREAESRLTLDEERPQRLRELGLWLSRKARKLAKRYAKADDPALCAAALDALLLADPEATRAQITSGLASAARAYAAVEPGARPANRDLPMLRAAALLTYAPDLADRAGEVEARRREAAGRALAHVLETETEPAGLERALRGIVRDWPGTPAATEAQKRP